MLSLNPDLCPTHKAPMRILYRKPIARICERCKSEAGFRKMLVRYKIEKLRRYYWLSIKPGSAKLFEGL